MKILKHGTLGAIALAASVGIGLQLHDRGPLFAEARTYQPQQTDYEPIPTQPPATMRVVGFGHIDVEGGTVPLTVPNIGQIEKVLVEEGLRVDAGQPLVKLRDEKAKAQLAQAEAQVRQASVRIDQAKRALELFQLQIEKQTQSIVAAETRFEAAQNELARLEPLVQSSVLSSDKFASANDRLPELKAALEVERLKLKEIELQKPDMELQLAQAALEAAEAQARLARENLDSHLLTAPQSGVILRLAVSAGQTLGDKPMAPPVWFCPDKPRIVRCEINEEFASRVDVGMRAEVYSDDMESTPWRGRVVRCADWIAHRRSLLDEPFQRNDVRTLECIVELEGEQATPRIGRRMRVVLFNE